MSTDTSSDDLSEESDDSFYSETALEELEADIEEYNCGAYGLTNDDYMRCRICDREILKVMTLECLGCHEIQCASCMMTGDIRINDFCTECVHRCDACSNLTPNKVKTCGQCRREYILCSPICAQKTRRCYHTRCNQELCHECTKPREVKLVGCFDHQAACVKCEVQAAVIVPAFWHICTRCGLRMCPHHEEHDYSEPFVCGRHISSTGCKVSKECVRMLVPERQCIVCDTYCCQHEVLAIPGEPLIYVCDAHKRTCRTCWQERPVFYFHVTIVPNDEIECCSFCHALIREQVNTLPHMPRDMTQWLIYKIILAMEYGLLEDRAANKLLISEDKMYHWMDLCGVSKSNTRSFERK